MIASLMSRIKISQDFSPAARPTWYLMKNVLSVPANLSSRECSALDCRTHNLDLTLTARYSSTQTMSCFLCLGGKSCTSSTSIKFSSSQVPAAVPFSALRVGICTNNAISSCVRSIDGFSHNMSFTSEPRAIRSSLARHFLFLISHCQVCLSHLLWIRQVSCMPFPAFVSDASSAFIIIPSILFSTLVGMESTNPYNQLSTMFLLRYVRRALTFVLSSVERASTNCSPALPRIKLWGIRRIANYSGIPCPRNRCQKSRLATHLISAPPWCQRNEHICLLVFISKHSIAPSEFQLCLVCIVVSGEANFTTSPLPWSL